MTYLGRSSIENRHGLIADAMATQADGLAERDAGLLMLHVQWTRAPGRRTVGADTAYDVRESIDLARELSRTRHASYAMSQHARPRTEPAFGWLKTIAWMRKVKLRGLPKADWLLVFASAAFNLLRLPQVA